MIRARTLAVVALATSSLFAACSDSPGVHPLAPEDGAAVVAAASGSNLEVTSSGDAGPGTLRAAIEAASADPAIKRIQVRVDGPITLQSPLVYTGAQSLRIDGHGAVLLGHALGDRSGTPALDAALVANGGGDLELRDLTVRNSTGNGIIVDVPDARTGVVVVALDGVVVEGSARHGVIVNDQVDYFADPFTRAEGGSAADVQVRVVRSTFSGNGFAGLDYDGIRVNEGGAGTMDVEIRHSRFDANGADGVELDERAAGDALVAVQHTVISRNGFFSSEDFDDGLDVDELGPGGIDARFLHVTAVDNAEQGIDLNENNLGDLRVEMNQVDAQGNAEEGIEFEEDDDFEDFPEESWGGDLHATLRNVTASANGANDGDAGLKIREKFAGSLFARVDNATLLDNEVGGLQLREGEAGDLTAELRGVTALRNDGHGIEVREDDEGQVDVSIVRATSSDNTGAGVRLRGDGQALLQQLTASGNGGGTVVADPTIEVTERGA